MSSDYADRQFRDRQIHRAPEHEGPRLAEGDEPCAYCDTPLKRVLIEAKVFTKVKLADGRVGKAHNGCAEYRARRDDDEITIRRFAREAR